MNRIVLDSPQYYFIMTTVVDFIKNIVTDNIGFKKDAISLWEELEEQEFEGDRNFYRSFQKIPATSSIHNILNIFKNKFPNLDIHFKEGKEEEEVKESEVKRADSTAQIGIMARIVRSLQALMKEHSISLDLLKELLINQEFKLDQVEKKMETPGEKVTQYLEHSIADKMEEVMKELKKQVGELKEELEQVKQENLNLKKVASKVAEETDETRQRGMKGNIKIYAPHLTQQPRPGDGRMETLAEMCCRGIQGHTGADIQATTDVIACHKLPEAGNYILRVGNMREGSGWEALTAGMVTGKYHGRKDEYFRKNGVHLSFQVTQTKAKLLHQVRLARKQGLLSKFSINENAKITIRRARHARTPEGQPRPKEVWEEVKSLATLQQMFPGADFPLATPAREDRGARPARPGQ